MLIAVDIGNTSITIGYFTHTDLIVQKIATYPLRPSSEYGAIINDFLALNHIEKKGVGVIISSVVAGRSGVIVDALERLFPAQITDILVVTQGMRSDVNLAIEAPGEFGTDRLADAVAAYEAYKSAVAVLNFGTATTITVVDENANCIGGAIMPGLGLMNDSLDQQTSKLRKIDMEGPVAALGKETAGCIRSGIFFGTAGAVERILAEIEKETGRGLMTVVTGGYGPLIANYLNRPHDINPHLTLQGLRLLYTRNKGDDRQREDFSSRQVQ
jgi:type III pantothenate kinase